VSFDPFEDFQTRGYLRNHFADKEPKIVKLKEHNAFRLHVGEALSALATRPALCYRDVLETHKCLFADYYPWAGQDRAAILPDLAVGKGGRYDLFSHPLDSERAIEYALGLARDRTTMREKPGEIMGLLAYGHPFLEGNGRTGNSKGQARAASMLSWSLTSGMAPGTSRRLRRCWRAIPTLGHPPQLNQIRARVSHPHLGDPGHHRSLMPIKGYKQGTK
jgi:cell filamentation protein